MCLARITDWWKIAFESIETRTRYWNSLMWLTLCVRMIHDVPNITLITLFHAGRAHASFAHSNLLIDRNQFETVLILFATCTIILLFRHASSAHSEQMRANGEFIWGIFLFVLIILSIMLTNNPYSDVSISWYSTRNRDFLPVVALAAHCVDHWPMFIEWMVQFQQIQWCGNWRCDGGNWFRMSIDFTPIRINACLFSFHLGPRWKVFFMTYRPLSMRLIVTTSDLLEQVKSNLDFFVVESVHRKSNMLQQKQFHIISSSSLRVADASSNSCWAKSPLLTRHERTTSTTTNEFT